MQKNSLKKAFSLVELSIVLLIIGIIIAGVTQSNILLSKFRLNIARSATQNSPVASISDLFLWLDSTSKNSFDEISADNDQPVSNWYDLNPASTIKRNFTSSVGYQPLYKTNGINNLPILRFDGSNDYMISATTKNTEMMPNSTVTMFFVAKIAPSASAMVPFAFQLDANNRCFPIIDTGNVMRFDCPNGTNGLLTGTTNIGNSLEIITLFKSDTKQTIYLNGTSEATQGNSLSFSSSFSSEMLIGRYTADDNVALATAMDLGEVIIFSRALKTEERKSIESYLSRKWKINLSS